MKKVSPQGYELYVGIDVSAATLSMASGSSKETIGQAITVEQSKTGYRQMIRALKAKACAPARVRVVMEARLMQGAAALHQAGFQVTLLNPKQAHHYALSEAEQAKTDAIDARLLAQLTADKALPIWEPASANAEPLDQRLVEREQLIERQQMVRNELHALRQRMQPDPQVVARKQATLEFYAQQIAAIDRELKALLRHSPWAALVQRLQTIPGIALLGAAWLFVITHGFTPCDGRRLSRSGSLPPRPRSLESPSSYRSWRSCTRSPRPVPMCC